MTFQVIPNGGSNATADSISIPLTDLSSEGLTSGLMTNNQAGMDASIYALLETLQSADFTGIVGVSKPANKAQALPAVGLINNTFSFTSQKVLDRVSNTLSVVPVPTSGANNGVGAVAFTDIFANAVKVASAGAVASEALLIPTADLAVYDSSLVHATLDLSGDNRLLLSALFHYLANAYLLRSATDASAKTAGSVGTESVIAVPVAYTQTTDPTTDLDSADFTSGKKALISRTYSITIQQAEQQNNSYSVNTVTA